MFEKVKLQFDLASLQKQVLEIINLYPPEIRKEKLTSWSVQSSNGDYKDGFQSVLPMYNGPMNHFPGFHPTPEWRDQNPNVKTIQDYDKPTQLCVGELEKIVHQLDSLGFWPRRGRILGLPINSDVISFHVDSIVGEYAARLHIPIFTNEHCFFMYKNDQMHFPHDEHGYLVDVSVPHKAINAGLTDRYHLVFCIWDTFCKTEKFKYQTNLIYPKSSFSD